MGRAWTRVTWRIMKVFKLLLIACFQEEGHLFLEIADWPDNFFLSNCKQCDYDKKNSREAVWEMFSSSICILLSLLSLLWFSFSKMTGKPHFHTVINNMTALKFTAMFCRDIVWWQLSLVEPFHCCFVILSYPSCKVYTFPYRIRWKICQHLRRDG